MSQQRKGGLGRGLAALIPTGPDEGPRLGNDAADVILGPRTTGPRTTPPRPRSTGQPAKRTGSSKPEADERHDASGESDVSRETVSRETPELVDPGAVYREIAPSAIRPNPK